MRGSDVGSSAPPKRSYEEQGEYFSQLAAAHTLEADGPMGSEDKLKLKEHTRFYYERAAAVTRVRSFWNFGYSSAEALKEIRGYIPEFGKRDETDGFSEQLYFATVGQLPVKLEELAGMSLLDIGCGLGEGLNFLSRILPATRMTGLDLSQNAVGSANARLSRGSMLNYVCGDAENAPFGDGEMDVIINVESAHTYPDCRKFLQEVVRVLKPGGYFSQVDLYSNGKRWDRTLSARKDVEHLEWISEQDISAGVRAAVRSRLVPGSFFERQFADVPPIPRAYAIRHFSFLYGRSFAGVPDDSYIKLLRRLRLFRTGQNAPISPDASYRLSVARRR